MPQQGEVEEQEGEELIQVGAAIYHDVCACGQLWVGPGEGVLVKSDSDVECMACGRQALVSPKYVERLRKSREFMLGLGGFELGCFLS